SLPARSLAVDAWPVPHREPVYSVASSGPRPRSALPRPLPNRTTASHNLRGDHLAALRCVRDGNAFGLVVQRGMQHSGGPAADLSCAGGSLAAGGDRAPARPAGARRTIEVDAGTTGVGAA